MPNPNEKIERECTSLAVRVLEVGQRGGAWSRRFDDGDEMDFWEFYFTLVTVHDMTQHGWTEQAHYQLKKLRTAATKLGVYAGPGECC